MAAHGSIPGDARKKDPADWLEVGDEQQRGGVGSYLAFLFPLIALVALLAALAEVVR